MKMSIYTVRDILAKEIGPLTLFANDDVAERAFAQMVQSGKDAMIARCPKDFELVRIGDIDTSCGEIVPTMVHVADALDFIHEN